MRITRQIRWWGLDALIPLANTYHILLDSADGLSVQAIRPEMHPAREKAPVAERAAGVRSPAG